MSVVPGPKRLFYLTTAQQHQQMLFILLGRGSLKSSPCTDVWGSQSGERVRLGTVKAAAKTLVRFQTHMTIIKC